MKQRHLPFPASVLKLAASLALACGTIAASAAVPQFQQTTPSAVPAGLTDRLIVKYKDATAATKGAAHVPALSASRAAIVTRAGQQFGVTMKLSHTIATGAHVFELSKTMTVEEAAAVAKELTGRDPNVEYAEPDRMLQAMLAPNDPRYSEQWSYYEPTGGMRANTAWDKATGAGVVVAVVDTGYRPHADLAGQILPGYDFISTLKVANDGDGRDNDAQDPGDAVRALECGLGGSWVDRPSSWHGTHVAGTIAAKTDNGVGVTGIAFNARILPVRVLGKCGGYVSDIADGIIWASGGTVANVPDNANKARVINMSLGGAGSCSATMQSAITGARSRGTVVVVAAGNDNGDAAKSMPANCNGVIAVAATNRSGGHAWYSNFGAVVDIAAPGGDTKAGPEGGVLSTQNAGTSAPGADSYGFYQGTSMATPHVAGVVALMLSKNPALTPDEVESKLKATARPFPASCTGCGSGIVDAAAAVDAVGRTQPPQGPTIYEREGNDSIGMANLVVTSGTTVLGNIGAPSDNDYFVVLLPPGKTLTATLTGFSRSLDYDLLAYDQVGTELARSENRANSTDAVTLANTGTTTVQRFVRVKYASGPTGPIYGKYGLKFTW